MNKSVVMMTHLDGAEIRTSDFAIENQASKNEGQWLDVFQNVMSDYQYGQLPKSILLDEGELYLVKVDDGMYSGFFKKIVPIEDGVLEDTAKVRIERMTLPSLVQFCVAKGWIRTKLPTEDSASTHTKNYGAMMDYYGGQLEAQDIQDKTVDNLLVKLETSSTEVKLDRKIKILELLEKLTN